MIVMTKHHRYGYRYGVKGVHPYVKATCSECGWFVTAGWVNPDFPCQSIECRAKTDSKLKV